MLRTYKFRLYPKPEQQQRIDFTLERCRLLYNRLLDERIHTYRTEAKTLSYYEQKKTLPARKKAIPALKEVHSQVLQNVVERLDKAYKAFYRRVQNGGKTGFPRFKGESRYRSFTYPQSGFSVEGKYLKLSKIGEVRIRLHRQIAGTIKTCSIVKKNGRYYACLAVEQALKPLPKTGKEVGVDLGIKHLAVTSDEQFFASPHPLRRSERRLKQLQRLVSKRKKGSHRRKKAICLLARMHEKIANQRKDYTHRISHQLVKRYDLIAFEDLNVQGMVKNHHLAKSIVDAGWRQLVQYTTYKAESAGKRVVQVNPHQTSQRCASCGEIVKKTLAERVHRCPFCGYEQDRDVNAAINILQLARQKAS
ncbi:RNA-guided endonuclease InsQ/TnpB family protein [Melghirimyces algeriensis]|uniref:Putative transposase n=2 Tax=Thermoactinomycetaceae TaxID=186824 RepID=A0A521F3W0_9BACL|nr:RNA-guided endonuclease TnpB family protein [Melghirimyces algeriensis]SMO90210.1 putative transposase [Melghirimyces algeriensis]